MRINHNLSSMVSQGALSRTGRAMSKSLERLSTGLRINSAADDAAGLGVSENLRTMVRGMGQALKNTQDAIALLQIADGALNEQADILQRMRELVIQAKNDTYTQTERNYMGEEFEALYYELDRIAQVTKYNGMNVLASRSNDNLNGTPHVVGDATNKPIYESVDKNVFGANDDGTTFHFNMMIGADYTDDGDEAARNTDTNSWYTYATNMITIQMGEMDGRGLFSKNVAAADPMRQLLRAGILENPFDWQDDLAYTSLSEKLNYILQLVDGDAGNTSNGSVIWRSGSNVTGLGRVNQMRAYIGAMINRLDHNVNNLMNQQAGQQAAESLIRDADFAQETAAFTRNQILTSSGTAMLGQANMAPQSVLSLLR